MFVVLVIAGVSATVSPKFAIAQEIKYEDRIGSNRDFDMCENYRFDQITRLVEAGTISQRQGYNIWKRIASDKEATARLLGEAVNAGELTQDQADRLLPILDLEMNYIDTRHGRFGQPKVVTKGQFEPGEVSAENRAAVWARLIAANERGEIYDYDVASIMNQLYAGFDSDNAPAEEVARYRAALNPRIAQSGSMDRVMQNVQMERAQAEEERSESGYGKTEIQIADPGDWGKDFAEPIFSGPQPGEEIASLRVMNMRGEEAGQEIDPVELAGDKLHLMIFVSKSRTFGRFLGHLRQQLQAIEDRSGQAWAMSVIVCNNDANESANSFTVLDERYPANLVVGLSTDGSDGPPAYGLDRNLTATVIVVRDGRVVHNLPYAGDAFYTQPHILGAVASAMEVDHDTLRTYIEDTPGDAASAAYARRMNQNADSSSSTRQGFRKRLAPLVLDGTLARAEAAEIFQVSGDADALRRKVESLVEEEKLTPEQADELLRDDDSVDDSPAGGDTEETESSRGGRGR